MSVKATERIFFLVLPPGSYTDTGVFYDENDEVVSPEWANVAAHAKPKCLDYVSADDFTFTTTGVAIDYCHKAVSSGDICCSSQCGGKCGGSNCCNCNHGSGGCGGCCAGAIGRSGRICEHFYELVVLSPLKKVHKCCCCVSRHTNTKDFESCTKQDSNFVFVFVTDRRLACDWTLEVL